MDTRIPNTRPSGHQATSCQAMDSRPSYTRHQGTGNQATWHQAKRHKDIWPQILFSKQNHCAHFSIKNEWKVFKKMKNVFRYILQNDCFCLSGKKTIRQMQMFLKYCHNYFLVCTTECNTCIWKTFQKNEGQEQLKLDIQIFYKSLLFNKATFQKV